MNVFDPCDMRTGVPKAAGVRVSCEGCLTLVTAKFRIGNDS
jgi:hypothetical protein